MKLFLSYFVLVVCLLATGCGKRANAVWFYTYSELGPENDYISEPNRLLTNYNLNPSNFLSTQADGNYTIDFGKGFEYGKWQLDDSVLVLTNSARKKSFIIVQLTGKEMMIKVPLLAGRPSIWHFERWSMPMKTNADNPFSLQNNLWRLKATHKENDTAIVARLRNYFAYWEKYFNWGLVSSKDYLDVRSLPGPIKIYGNGFALVDYDKWPSEWTSLFYDDEDSRKAYDKLNYFFEHDHIAWANTDNKYKMFISAFQQMQQKLN